MKPQHRTHAGWVEVVRGRPEIPGRVRRLLVDLVEFGTYRNKRMNQYSCTRARLAQILGIDERNVQRSLVAAVDDGWLVICVRGQKGRQQVYHRSVPWDPPRHWSAKPCPTCSWRSRGPGVKNLTPVVGVDLETGEIQGGESVSLNVSLNVSPISTNSAPTSRRVLHISDPALGHVRDRFAPLVRVA